MTLLDQPCVPGRPNGTDLVGDIIAFENGDLSALGTLELFGALIRSGQVWTLQGTYGRTASGLIAEGLILEDGTITDAAHDRLAEFPEED